MPRCLRCRKSSLFLKLNSLGYCRDCVQAEEDQRAKRMADIKHWKDQKEIAKQQKRTQLRSYYSFLLDSEYTSYFFSMWGRELHETDDQMNRQHMSLYQTVPIAVNKTTSSAVFMGFAKKRIYETSLTTCTCDDFQRRKRPCKHIYRLYYELTNTPNNSIIHNVPSDLLESFMTLSSNAQWTIQFLCDIRPRPVLMQYNDTTKELVEKEVLVTSEVTDYTSLLNDLTKDKIILALAKKGISGFNPNWSKVMLIDWVNTTQIGFLRKYFKNYALFQFAPHWTEWEFGIKESLKNYQISVQNIITPF